jgi:Tfp pilus assembly protein PilW
MKKHPGRTTLLKGSGGFTTAELLVAALFGLIVMAALYGFYRDQLYTLVSQEAKIATLEDTRGALDLMARELRNAGSWTSGTQPSGCQRVVSATASSVRIQADLDGNGDCTSATGEDVTYDLSTATSTCPGTIIRRNGDCLVANVVIPTGSSFLKYYDSSATVLTPPMSDLSVIKRVEITFSVQVSNPDPRVGGTLTSSLLTGIEFRN